MSNIPLKLLKLKRLIEVPCSEYADVNVPKDLNNEKSRLGFIKMLRQKPSKAQQESMTKSRLLSFNAAVWLSFVKTVEKPISIWLTYKDASGEYSVLVDEQFGGESTSIMLSGNVSFKVIGDIEYLRACCAGVDSIKELTLEEIHVTRLKNEQVYLNPIQRMA